jgi:hypothetical protein
MLNSASPTKIRANSRLSFDIQAGDSKKSYRALNIANYFRSRNLKFSWFHKNTISITTFDDCVTKETVYITGAKNCYRVRHDVYKLTNGQGDFIQRDYPDSVGFTLVVQLVRDGILPKKYLSINEHE